MPLLMSHLDFGMTYFYIESFELNSKAMARWIAMCFLPLFIFLASGVSPLYAQSYLPFPDSNATWKIDYGETDVNCNKVVTSLDSIGGDTIINSILYKKVYTVASSVCSATPPMCAPIGPVGYQGAIRMDTTTGLSRFIPDGWSSDTLLYDFNLQSGDTIKSYITGGKSLIVDSIIVISYFGIPRRTITFTNSLGRFIEGIGGTGGIITSMVGFIGAAYVLVCFNENNTTNFIGPGECSSNLDCNTIVNIRNKSIVKNNFLVFPNPTASAFRIYFQGNIPVKAKLQLTNFSGIVVRRFYFDAPGDQIQLAELPTGIYYLSIEITNPKTKLFSQKLLVIRPN